MEKISLNFGLKFRTNVFISHVCVHYCDSVLNLLFFAVKLLYDSPDLIKAVCKNKAADKLNYDRVRNFIFILRSDISITD